MLRDPNHRGILAVFNTESIIKYGVPGIPDVSALFLFSIPGSPAANNYAVFRS